MPVVRVFGRNGGCGREDAADADARRETIDRQQRNPRCGRRQRHTEADDDETEQDRGSTADPIRDVAHDQRADAHADEFHRQDEAERRPVDAPLCSDAGRSKTDRQDIEAVDGQQQDAQGDGDDLQPSHRCLSEYGAWVPLHHHQVAYSATSIRITTNAARLNPPLVCVSISL